MQAEVASAMRLSRLARLSAYAPPELPPSVYAAIYFFHWQIAAHGRAFASRKRKGDPPPEAAAWLAALETPEVGPLLDYLGNYQFRGVIPNVPAVLCQWLRGSWPLELRRDIPTPRAILRAQARGTRPVTAITAYPRMLKPVLHKPNAFAFFLHDLEHAYKFFHAPALYAGQCGFFAALEAAIEDGAFTPYFDDPVFVDKLNYLMSDMNTHPQHSRQYLRAILVEFYLRRDRRAPTAPLGAPAHRAIDAVMRALHDGLRLDRPGRGKANGDKALCFTA